MDNFPNPSGFKNITLDTESTGLKWWEDKMFGFSIAADGIEPIYFDIREEPNSLIWLQDVINNAKEYAFHNSKYDMHVLREAGLKVDPSKSVCTVIGAALIDEHELSYDLDYLGKKYIGQGKGTEVYEKLANMFGGKPTKNAQMKNLHRAPSRVVAPYAIDDVIVTHKLRDMHRDIIEHEELTRVFELERRLVPVLMDMENRGVRIDAAKARKAIKDIDKIAINSQRELDKLAGFKINPNPSKSIHQLFNPKQNKDGYWVARDGTVLESTPAGKASINDKALRAMSDPAAAMILNLRKLLKTRDTFLKGHILGHEVNGVIHANFNQTKSDNALGTGTGRLSCNAPALQQIHKRDEEIASIVRAIFLPDVGQEWNCRDWSQMDFRIFAHYAEVPQILAAYQADPDLDFHQSTSDLTGIPRKPRFAGDANAKQINLGMVFGMGQGTMAYEMGLPYTVEVRRGREYKIPGPEAREVFKRYNEAVPGVKQVLDRASSVAKSRGYVKTIMGRRIRFPGGKFTHKAGGLIFQGTAADCLKQKLCEVHEYLDGTDGRLMLNVHDEFDSSLPKGAEGERLSKGIGEIVEQFGPDDEISLNVPIRSDCGVGPNWWEACKE